MLVCREWSRKMFQGLGDFRVAFRLCFKASPSAKPFMWKLVLFTRKFWFIYMWIKLVSIWKASHTRTRFETEAKGNSEIATVLTHLAVIVAVPRQVPSRFLSQKLVCQHFNKLVCWEYSLYCVLLAVYEWRNSKLNTVFLVLLHRRRWWRSSRRTKLMADFSSLSIHFWRKNQGNSCTACSPVFVQERPTFSQSRQRSATSPLYLYELTHGRMCKPATFMNVIFHLIPHFICRRLTKFWEMLQNTIK